MSIIRNRFLLLVFAIIIIISISDLACSVNSIEEYAEQTLYNIDNINTCSSTPLTKNQNRVLVLSKIMVGLFSFVLIGCIGYFLILYTNPGNGSYLNSLLKRNTNDLEIQELNTNIQNLQIQRYEQLKQKTICEKKKEPSEKKKEPSEEQKEPSEEKIAQAAQEQKTNNENLSAIQVEISNLDKNINMNLEKKTNLEKTNGQTLFTAKKLFNLSIIEFLVLIVTILGAITHISVYSVLNDLANTRTNKVCSDVKATDETPSQSINKNISLFLFLVYLLIISSIIIKLGIDYKQRSMYVGNQANNDAAPEVLA